MSNLDQNQQNEMNPAPIVLDQNLKPIQENEISEDIDKLLSNAIDKVKDAIKRVQGIEITDNGININNPIADFQRIYGIAIETASKVEGVGKLYARFDKPESYIRRTVEGALDKLQDEGVGVLSTPQMSGLILLPSKTKFVPEMISGLKQIRYYPNSNMRSITYVPYVIRKDGDTVERIPFTYGDNKVISFLDFNYAYNVGNVFLEYYRGKDFNPVIENNLSVAILSVDVNKCFENNMSSVVIVPEINSALIDIETLKSTMPDTLVPELIGLDMYPLGNIKVEKEFDCAGKRFELIEQYEVRPNEAIYYVRVGDSSSVFELLTENQESLETTLNEISNYIHDNVSPNKESMKPFVIPGAHKGKGTTDSNDVYLCFIQHHVSDQTKFKSELPADIAYSELIDNILIVMNPQLGLDIEEDTYAHFVSLSSVVDFVSETNYVKDHIKAIFSNYLVGDSVIKKLFDFDENESPTLGSEYKSLKLNKVNLSLYLTEVFNKGLFGENNRYIPIPLRPSDLLGEEAKGYTDANVSDILFTRTNYNSTCELNLYKNDRDHFFHDEAFCFEVINKINAGMLLNKCEEIKESNIVSIGRADIKLMATTFNKNANGYKMLSSCRLFKMPDGSRVMGFMVLTNEEEITDFSKNELKFGLDNWYLVESIIKNILDNDNIILIDNKFTELKFSGPDSSNLTMFGTYKQNQNFTFSNDENEDVVLFVAEDSRHYIGVHRIPKPVII